MIGSMTPAGTPVLRRIGQNPEQWVPTHTISKVFTLAEAARGLEDIPAGKLCVYVDGLICVDCDNVKPRKGLHVAPNPTWGPFYKGNGGDLSRIFDGAKETARNVYELIKGGRS